MENVKYLNDLCKNGEIDDFNLAYVIISLNYRDLPEFVKMCDEMQCPGQLREFMDCGEASQMCLDFDKYNIVSKDHLEHNKFVEILNQPIFQSCFCLMNDIIRNVQKEDY